MLCLFVGYIVRVLCGYCYFLCCCVCVRRGVVVGGRSGVFVVDARQVLSVQPRGRRDAIF